MKHKWWAFVQPLRLCVQCAVVLALCLLPWANAHGWTRIYGSFFALDVYGLPFADPLSVVQSLLQGAVPAPALWWGAGLTLAIALMCGRIFCGWLCPYGLVSEWLWKWRGRAGTRNPPNREMTRVWWRSALLLCGMGLSVVGIPLLYSLSMPGGLSLLPLKIWYGGTVAGLVVLLGLPVLVLLLEGVTGRRWWCSYVCPQAVLLSWAAVAGKRLWGLRWQVRTCTCGKGQRPCEHSCSLGLAMRQRGGPQRGECVHCLACVTACRAQGAGALTVGRGDAAR